MNERLPIFVYGTLMAGHPNFGRIFHGRKVDTAKATLAHHALLANERSYFPYLVWLAHVPEKFQEDASDQVVGQLLYLQEEDYDELLEWMDELEGVEFSHYERVKVGVTSGGKYLHAWAYRMPEKATREAFATPFCAFDDWADHVEKHKTYKVKE